jgi:hypothetical protein
VYRLDTQTKDVTMNRKKWAIALAATAVVTGGVAKAAGTGGIVTKTDKTVKAPFDIVHTQISVDKNVATFSMRVSGKAGAARPARSGKLAGARVFSYVWPTSLDPSLVGFESKSGILALAATSHRDFDDTPLYDENRDGSTTNDGDLWHAHWVVLGKDDACGKGALKVLDIAEGTTPKLPKTWPGLPILIDSPGWSPVIAGDTVEIRVPFEDTSSVKRATFDGVTAGLRVNASVHDPLLCVENVFKVASGDLSLPGKVDG